MTFKAWVPDYGEDIGDAADVDEVFDADHAATKFAERVYNSGDPFEEIEVAVAEVGEDGAVGPARTFHVDVEFDPTFCAMEVT